MDKRSCGATRHAILACLGALCLLAQTAVADYDTVTISTLQGGAPYYSQEEFGYISTTMYGSFWRSLYVIPDSPLPYMAVGFTLPAPTDPRMTGAVVESLTLPFFVDVAVAGVSIRARLVEDMTTGNPDLTEPNLAGVVATFISPAWQAIPTYPHGATALATLNRQSSSALRYDRSYWLVLGQVDSLDGMANANWYLNTAENTDPFVYTRYGYDAETAAYSIIPVAGSGAAPAYSMTFTPVPEPSAGALLALAGVGGLLRRRRRA